MRWRIVVQTESPVCIARRHATVGLPVETLPYIPGSALRGAFAQAWLKQKGNNAASSQEFQSVFTGAGVRWGNLYPARGEQGSYPVPLSAQTCKWSHGFRQDADESERGDGVWDILLWQAFRTQTSQSTGYSQCPHCKAPLDDFDGFYLVVGSYPSKAKAKTRLLARTALMETTETAKAAMLFTLEAIEEGQSFTGFIEAPDNAPGLADLQQLMNQIETLRLGSAKTRGLGLVTIGQLRHLKPSNPYLDLSAPLSTRLSKFQQAAQNVGLDSGRFWFSLTLYSDAIVTDAYGRFKSGIDKAALELEERFWGGSPPFPSSLRNELSFATTHTVSGWNMADGWRLPKYDVVAINNGSVFLFSVDGQDQAAVTSCLQKLETEGIGDRKQEGFGQVIVSSPFHTDPEGGA